MLFTRREAIKKIGLVGGLILAKPSPLLARLWIHQGGGGGGGTAAAWADWGQTYESILPVDNYNVCIYSGTVNETSSGIVSGANLVFLQNGTIDPATGSGLTLNRALDGIDDNFQIPVALVNAAFANANKTWAWFAKIAITASAAQVLIDAEDAVVAERLKLRTNTNFLQMDIIQDGVNESNNSTNHVPSDGTVIIVGIWADNSSVLRAGWTTTVTSMPTKLSHFPVAQRCALASLKGDFSAETFTSCRIFERADEGGENLPGNIYWTVAANVCPIDNGA